MATKPQQQPTKRRASDDYMDGVRLLGLAMTKIEKAVGKKPSTAALAASYYLSLGDLAEAVKPEVSRLHKLLETYKFSYIPDKFKDEKIKTITVEHNGNKKRVTVNNLWRASIVEGMKDRALKWLRSKPINAGEIIQETVNAQTLGAFAKAFNEEKGIDLPDDLFKVSVNQTTSVTGV